MLHKQKKIIDMDFADIKKVISYSSIEIDKPSTTMQCLITMMSVQFKIILYKTTSEDMI